MDMQNTWTDGEQNDVFQANSFPFQILSPDITLSRLTPPFCLLSSAISFWALKNRSTTFRTKKIRNVSKFLKTQHISELKKRCRKFQTANQQIIFTLRFFWDFAIPKAEIATSINFCSNSSMRFFASFFQSKSSRENLPAKPSVSVSALRIAPSATPILRCAVKESRDIQGYTFLEALIVSKCEESLSESCS